MPHQPSDQCSVETKLGRLGRNPDEQCGFINCPIYRGSTVLYKSFDDALKRRSAYWYGTAGNPTVTNLQNAWTELTGGAGSIVVSSGMQAIAYALLAAANSGDNILVADAVYLPTRNLCDNFLMTKGITTTYYDPCITADELRELLRQKPNTTVIFMESPGSQTFEVQDVPMICAVAREFNITTIIDNTWASPIFFDALGIGCDISVEAGTKYVGGHSDMLLGLISANEEWYPKLRAFMNLMQSVPGNEDCYLGLRGLRTMYIRLKEAEKRALEIARFMESREEVLKVLHPALPSCRGHEIWKRDFTGSSGLFSIVLRPQYTLQDVERMIENYKLFSIGFSWGGFESLVMCFDCSAYRTATTFAPGGILIRFQIGLESLEDLKQDLCQGFDKLSRESMDC
ncbi:putative cystathionine beta-lyase [Leishmania mexicana MHOM/GT/2001/U1103]|uniref:Cystathionine beta-lyase n=1 Tax=Leishmania mexicana (strain MHOM/GT/2001/U1103) TaxID=929439 RepID=E9B343_LEIMU|nr:putative cystathionine beta-lyase [Leishmania mexicana MHOM/GT/2001/U1103]CBZ29659.1 putative cystathionine beta-lyase [Leishmania mexicana MHOM/GT/2001/U1103]